MGKRTENIYKTEICRFRGADPLGRGAKKSLPENGESALGPAARPLWSRRDLHQMENSWFLSSQSHSTHSVSAHFHQ